MNAGYGFTMNRVRTPELVFTGPAELVISGVPADATRASALRRALAAWLEVTAFDRARITDIALATYEALANAVEHAYRNVAAGTMTLRAVYSNTDRTLEVAVTDAGHWQAPTVDPLRGNGLPLISALTQESAVEHTDSGTTVVMNWSADTPLAPVTDIFSR